MEVMVFSGFSVSLKLFLCALMGIAIIIFHVFPNMGDFESVLKLISENSMVFAFLFCGNLVVYIVGGSVIARGFRITSYSTLLISVFVSCFLEVLLMLIPLMIGDFRSVIDFFASGGAWPAVFWLLYMAGTLLGAKYSSRSAPALSEAQ